MVLEELNDMTNVIISTLFLVFTFSCLANSSFNRDQSCFVVVQQTSCQHCFFLCCREKGYLFLVSPFLVWPVQYSAEIYSDL